MRCTAAVPAQGRHDAELHLTVVRSEQDMVGIPRHKGLADLAATLRPDGDVLQVGLGAAQAARRRHGLHVLGVDAAGFRIDEFRQRPDIGGQELIQLPVLEHFPHNGMGVHQLLEHILPGGVLPRLGLLGFFGQL